MGSSTKKIVTLAAIAGVGYATGGFGLAAGAGSAASGAGMGAASGAGFVNAAASGGGFFSTMSGFEIASLGFGALSAGASIMGGMAAADQAAFQQSQLEEQKALANLQGLQMENTARERARRLKSSSMAMAAAQGIDVSKSRSFLAFLDGNDDALEDELGSIRVNTLSKGRVYGLQATSAGNKASSATMSGFVGAGASVFGTARTFLDTRTA